MKPVTINLNKVSRGYLYNPTSECMCVMGQVLHKAHGYSEDELAGLGCTTNVVERNPHKGTSHLLRKEAVVNKIEQLNDSHKPWDTKVEKIRPLLRELGYTPRFVR
jgi:hypothetical protein